MLYHVNPKTGNPNICRASKGMCPFGAKAPHYESKEEARLAYESSQRPAGPLRKKKAESNVDPAHGYLKRELAEKLQVHDLHCAGCGGHLDPWEVRQLIADDYAECDCGQLNLLSKLSIEISPDNPSYRFLAKEEVLKATWYHATDKEDWLQHPDGDFLAHVGTEAAAFDRAITNYAPHQAKSAPFFLYEVSLKEDAEIADQVLQDENNDESLALGKDVTRYVNRWEDIASISLAVKPEALRITGKRLVQPEEAHEKLTPYNIPDYMEVEDYWG